MEVGSSSLPGTTSDSKVSILNWEPGGLAQLARAPALQAGGQRFESVILHSVCENADRRSEAKSVSDNSKRARDL